MNETAIDEIDGIFPVAIHHNKIIFFKRQTFQVLESYNTYIGKDYIRDWFLAKNENYCNIDTSAYNY